MTSILIIDDDRMLLDMLRLALTKNGYNVETASNGKQGLEKFDPQLFDVVITDLRMPFIDGNTLAKHIRKTKAQSTSIIGISGTPWSFEADNFDKVLKKPFSIKSILGVLQELTTKKIELSTPPKIGAYQAFQ